VLSYIKIYPHILQKSEKMPLKAYDNMRLLTLLPQKLITSSLCQTALKLNIW